jgi:hypothetical protein
MDEVSWIEVLPRHRENALRQRVHGASLTIGRAWDNDIVVDDPHVAAHHLRLTRGDDGTWVAEDLGSVNGLHIGDTRQRHERIVLATGMSLRIGQTLLRVHDAHEPVAPEVVLTHRRSHWPIALALLALVFLLELLQLWLGETGEPKLIRYLTQLLILAAAVILWTSGWAVDTRLFAGHARFGTHLLIASAALLAYALYDQLSELGAFALSWPGLARFSYVAAWLLLAAACYAHLRVLGRARLPLKAAAVCVLAALGIATQTLKQSDWRANYGQPTLLQRLEPPWLRLTNAQESAAFFTGADALKTRVDKARSEEPVGADANDD